MNVRIVITCIALFITHSYAFAFSSDPVNGQSFLIRVTSLLSANQRQNDVAMQLRSALSNTELEVAINFLIQTNTKANINTKLSSETAYYFSIHTTQPTTSKQLQQALKSFGSDILIEPEPVRYPIYTPDDPNIAQQYYLDVTNAYEAWDIQRDNEEIIIAIVDSGIDIDHPDLAANIHVNPNEIPDNGIDDDNDGYIDNVSGWDFVGSDHENIQEDNNPNADLVNINHGTYVAGCASGVVNNNLGIAGISFNAKIMPLKHSAESDTRANGAGYVLRAIDGVIYAAKHGAHIINASYGGPGYSQIEQEIFSYLAQEYGVLVVAAAGNSNSDEPIYPADYDYVLSVAATDADDKRWWGSSFGYGVDISAPGRNIYTTTPNGNYGSASGTSFSSPIVAGVAALVKAKYPTYTGAQIGELLRVSADPAFKENLTEQYKDKMGNGRVDAYAALTSTSPAVRFDNVLVNTAEGTSTPRPGEEANISGIFKNFLAPVNNLTVSMESLHSDVSVTQNEINISAIGTLNEADITENPFVIQVSEGVGQDQEVVLKLNYSAENYTDIQFIKILVNPTTINIFTDSIATTIASVGRIGSRNFGDFSGLGFAYGENNFLYELGTLIGTSAQNLANNVRGASSGTVDDDFIISEPIAKQIPGNLANIEVIGAFENRGTNTDGLAVETYYKIYAWEEAPNANYIIVEYDLYNKSGTSLSGLYAGFYADWDVSNGGGTDKAAWNPDFNMGYVYGQSTTDESTGYAGIQVLSGKPNYYAINNDASVDPNGFGVYDGYTDEEKWKSMSSSIAQAQAGGDKGGDVSHTVSSGPYNMRTGSSQKVFFAIHAAENLSQLIASAEAAKLNFQSNFESPNGLFSNDISLFIIGPNPSESIWRVESDDSSKLREAEFMLYSLDGRKLSININREEELVELSNEELKAGIYILNIEHRQQVYQYKLLKH